MKRIIVLKNTHGTYSKLKVLFSDRSGLLHFKQPHSALMIYSE